MAKPANLQQEENSEHIGVIGDPEDPIVVTNNEDIGTIERPVDPKMKSGKEGND